jgi:hypothetical protein
MTLIAGIFNRTGRAPADSVCLEALIHSTGWRDYRYAIQAAEIYCWYAEISKGEFSFSTS